VPGVVFLDARRSGIPGSDFHDSCHPNDRGAAHLSAAIASAVARRPPTVPGRPVWLALTTDRHDDPAPLADQAAGGRSLTR
jgi:hypothetical protein